MCDASDYAIGAVIGQRIDGKPHVISYASKTLDDAQRNYTTTEKEMLAVVFAFEKFRSYLVCNKAIVYTDHAAVRYLMSKKEKKVCNRLCEAYGRDRAQRQAEGRRDKEAKEKKRLRLTNLHDSKSLKPA